MKDLNVTLSKPAAFSVCKNALVSCDINIDTESLDNGSTTVSFLSFGNKIQLTLTGTSHTTSINIHSKCAAVLQLIDWGKNSELENKIAEKIIQLTS